MKKREAIKKIKANQVDLDKLGVAHLSLFGSLARDDARESSDVDLLIEFRKPIGLFHFFRVQHFLEEILDVEKVDLLMQDAIKPALRSNILAEAIRVA